MADKNRFKETVDAAVDDMAKHGFDSAERLAYWEERIRRAAEAEMGPGAKMEGMLRDVLRRTYERMIAGGIGKYHPGVARWTIERVKPQLRAELDRRILASANLIRINKEKRKAETLQRFSGWASSIPAGGSGETDKRDAKARIKKPIASQPFEERRMLTDQGHKLASSLNEITAVGSGAIIAVWRSHWRQPNYDYREDHKERDEVVYLVPDSWALKEGLIKAANGIEYITSITRPGEEPYCRCFYVYGYSLRQVEKLAPYLLTVKGRAALDNARATIKAMA